MAPAGLRYIELDRPRTIRRTAIQWSGYWFLCHNVRPVDTPGNRRFDVVPIRHAKPGLSSSIICEWVELWEGMALDSSRRSYSYIPDGTYSMQRVANIGPQTIFPVPQGILDYNGTK